MKIFELIEALKSHFSEDADITFAEVWTSKEGCEQHIRIVKQKEEQGK